MQASGASSQIWPLDCSLSTTIKQCGREKKGVQTGYSLRFKTFFAFFLDLGFPCGLAGKESACNVGDLGSIPALGRSPGEGKHYLIQYSGLENSMDCILHGVKKSQT